MCCVVWPVSALAGFCEDYIWVTMSGHCECARAARHTMHRVHTAQGSCCFICRYYHGTVWDTVHSWRRCPARPDGDIRPEAILSTSFGGSRTAMYRQVTCTCQIWIPGWILPHFDVRTISVASKLKELQIFLYY